MRYGLGESVIGPGLPLPLTSTIPMGFTAADLAPAVAVDSGLSLPGVITVGLVIGLLFAFVKR